jgi:hypothetical protein
MIKIKIKKWLKFAPSGTGTGTFTRFYEAGTQREKKSLSLQRKALGWVEIDL